MRLAPFHNFSMLKSNQMKSELYKAFKAINVANLTEDNKEELIRIFMATRDPLIRDHISFIFSDLSYTAAIPYIIKKINEKDLRYNSGTLVLSLAELASIDYFMDFIKIICKHEYEPRLIAFGAVQRLAPMVNRKSKDKALTMLETHRKELESTMPDSGENSALHFIEKTIELLKTG